MDEHRIGLKPATRRVWAPIGERPIAHGYHRFDWLYVTAEGGGATPDILPVREILSAKVDQGPQSRHESFPFLSERRVSV